MPQINSRIDLVNAIKSINNGETKPENYSCKDPLYFHRLLYAQKLVSQGIKRKPSHIARACYEEINTCLYQKQPNNKGIPKSLPRKLSFD